MPRRVVHAEKLVSRAADPPKVHQAGRAKMVAVAKPVSRATDPPVVHQARRRRALMIRKPVGRSADTPTVRSGQTGLDGCCYEAGQLDC